jgi:hypothetical protein
MRLIVTFFFSANTGTTAISFVAADVDGAHDRGLLSFTKAIESEGLRVVENSRGDNLPRPSPSAPHRADRQVLRSPGRSCRQIPAARIRGFLDVRAQDQDGVEALEQDLVVDRSTQRAGPSREGLPLQLVALHRPLQVRPDLPEHFHERAGDQLRGPLPDRHLRCIRVDIETHQAHDPPVRGAANRANTTATNISALVS